MWVPFLEIAGGLLFFDPGSDDLVCRFWPGLVEQQPMEFQNSWAENRLEKCVTDLGKLFGGVGGIIEFDCNIDASTELLDDNFEQSIFTAELRVQCGL